MTALQWLSLLLLTTGCIIKQFEHSYSSSAIKTSSITNSTISSGAESSFLEKYSLINIHLIWILVQVFCSCFAGVYNEYLLKSSRTTQVDMMLQNAFMYFDSILCNLLLLIYFDYQQPSLSALDKFFHTLRLIFEEKQILILLIICNNAAVGIVTSFFLKSLNSILKTFASALELLFTSILAWIFFAIPVSMYTFMAIFIVSTAVYLYSINPVNNPTKSPHEETSETKNEQDRRSVV